MVNGKERVFEIICIRRPNFIIHHCSIHYKITFAKIRFIRANPRSKNV